jgi:hypothetical protein
MIDAFCTVLALIVPAVLILWAITRKPDNMRPPELVWKEESTFRGWGYSNCKFIVLKPHPDKVFIDYAQEALDALAKHSCAAHPFGKSTTRGKPRPEGLGKPKKMKAIFMR